MAIQRVPSLQTGDAADEAFFLTLATAVNGKGAKKAFALTLAVNGQNLDHQMGTTFGWAASDYFIEVRAYDAAGLFISGVSVSKVDANVAALIFDDSASTLANCTFILDFTLF